MRSVQLAKWQNLGLVVEIHVTARGKLGRQIGPKDLGRKVGTRATGALLFHHSLFTSSSAGAR